MKVLSCALVIVVILTTRTVAWKPDQTDRSERSPNNSSQGNENYYGRHPGGGSDLKNISHELDDDSLEDDRRGVSRDRDQDRGNENRPFDEQRSRHDNNRNSQELSPVSPLAEQIERISSAEEASIEREDSRERRVTQNFASSEYTDDTESQSRERPAKDYGGHDTDGAARDSSRVDSTEAYRLAGKRDYDYEDKPHSYKKLHTKNKPLQARGAKEGNQYGYWVRKEEQAIDRNRDSRERPERSAVRNDDTTKTGPVNREPYKSHDNQLSLNGDDSSRPGTGDEDKSKRNDVEDVLMRYRSDLDNEKNLQLGEVDTAYGAKKTTDLSARHLSELELTRDKGRCSKKESAYEPKAYYRATRNERYELDEEPYDRGNRVNVNGENRQRMHKLHNANDSLKYKLSKKNQQYPYKTVQQTRYYGRSNLVPPLYPPFGSDDQQARKIPEINQARLDSRHRMHDLSPTLRPTRRPLSRAVNRRNPRAVISVYESFLPYNKSSLLLLTKGQPLSNEKRVTQHAVLQGTRHPLQHAAQRAAQAPRKQSAKVPESDTENAPSRSQEENERPRRPVYRLAPSPAYRTSRRPASPSLSHHILHDFKKLDNRWLPKYPRHGITRPPRPQHRKLTGHAARLIANRRRDPNKHHPSEKDLEVLTLTASTTTSTKHPVICPWGWQGNVNLTSDELLHRVPGETGEFGTRVASLQRLPWQKARDKVDRNDTWKKIPRVSTLESTCPAANSSTMQPETGFSEGSAVHSSDAGVKALRFPNSFLSYDGINDIVYPPIKYGHLSTAVAGSAAVRSTKAEKDRLTDTSILVEGLRSPPIVPRTAKEENHVEFSEDAFWRTWKPPADIATYNGKTGLNTAVTQQKNTNNSVLSGQALLSGHPALMLRHHQRGSTLRQHGTLGRRAIAWNTYESPKQVSTKGILEGQQRTTGHGTASVGWFRFKQTDPDFFGMPHRPLSTTQRPTTQKSRKGNSVPEAAKSTNDRPEMVKNKRFPSSLFHSTASVKPYNNTRFKHLSISRRRPGSFAEWHPRSKVNADRLPVPLQNDTLAKAAILAVMLRPGKDFLHNIHSTMIRLDESARASQPMITAIGIQTSGRGAQRSAEAEMATDADKLSNLRVRNEKQALTDFTKIRTRIPVLKSAQVMQKKFGNLQVSGGHDRYGQNGEHRGRRKNDQKAQSRNAEPDVGQLPMERSSRHDEFEKNYDKTKRSILSDLSDMNKDRHYMPSEYIISVRYKNTTDKEAEKRLKSRGFTETHHRLVERFEIIHQHENSEEDTGIEESNSPDHAATEESVNAQVKTMVRDNLRANRNGEDIATNQLDRPPIEVRTLLHGYRSMKPYELVYRGNHSESVHKIPSEGFPVNSRFKNWVHRNVEV
ncbi:uncharacterized protein LOC111245382 isoform X2 [Varroa destructor]|uniref:Uncharacterized protein n=1 Tax=Varroa destructor TaxID=109461 RepID=A0A7M7M4Y7_VARDE|nr:uncharacterized protein LOC111245382 isoform X2 [Varroa destructor]